MSPSLGCPLRRPRLLRRSRPAFRRSRGVLLSEADAATVPQRAAYIPRPGTTTTTTKAAAAAATATTTTAAYIPRIGAPSHVRKTNCKTN